VNGAGEAIALVLRITFRSWADGVITTGRSPSQAIATQIIVLVLLISTVRRQKRVRAEIAVRDL
jgi:hypothetical protein